MTELLEGIHYCQILALYCMILTFRDCERTTGLCNDMSILLEYTAPRHTALASFCNVNLIGSPPNSGYARTGILVRHCLRVTKHQYFRFQSNVAPSCTRFVVSSAVISKRLILLFLFKKSLYQPIGAIFFCYASS